jgi:hypothetical protein
MINTLKKPIYGLLFELEKENNLPHERVGNDHSTGFYKPALFADGVRRAVLL